MGFKSAVQYNEERYGNFFSLQNDGNFADVIFLYRSKEDVLVADAHYIKSSEYSGYVHCCETGCPACAKGIRVQNKLFIPMYDLEKNKIVFWDRNTSFESQLFNDVFDKFPNPSEYVFRIVRHGVPRDVNTTYEIKAMGRNSSYPYEQILASANATLPDYYSTVIREYSSFELQNLLNVTTASAPTQDYVPQARPAYDPAMATPTVVPAAVSAPTFNAPPTDLPEYSAESEEDSTNTVDEVNF